MRENKKKTYIFSKIHCKEDALKVIREGSMGFFTVAALQAGLSYFLAPSLLFDAIVHVILAGILLKWKSKMAAILLLIIASSAGYMTITNRMSLTAEGGNNIVLATVVLWIAIRSVEATFKLNRNFKDQQS